MNLEPSWKQDGFLGAFTRELVRHCYNFEPGNVDRLRFPESYGRAWTRALKEWMLTFAERANFVHFRQRSLGHIEKSLSRVLDETDGFDWLYRNLADEKSRRLLLQLLAFRVLGPGVDVNRAEVNGPEGQSTFTRRRNC